MKVHARDRSRTRRRSVEAAASRASRSSACGQSRAPATPLPIIVHLPVVGGAPKHVPGAAGLVENAQVIHYWDPERRVGERFTDLFSLRTDGKPALAWDVWFAYGPGATWTDTPPHPDVAMHQLSLDANPNIKRLDSKAFAQQVNGLLTPGQAVAQRK